MYESVETVLALTQEAIGKLNASWLRKALTTALNAERVEVPVNMDPVLAELREIKDRIGVITTLQEKVVSLENKVESAFQVIHQQQLYLESIDNRERRSNLVIMGLSESSNDIGSTDIEKLRNVLSTANCPADIDPSRLAIRRLGQPNSTRPRPLHVTLNNQQQCYLKIAGTTYLQVYKKKDQ